MKKRILFVCTENACRSQMAEGFARHHGGELIEAHSAGSTPAKEVNPLAVEVMKEIGIDISSQAPKSILDLPGVKFDYVVGMGCENVCPAVAARQYIQWTIPDPAKGQIERFREVRDKIEASVLDLLTAIRKNGESPF
jgi:arsenate reductase